ncbi:class IV adenylate cyclase [Clostridium guangxiense]|uniref:class IV adenylate cyclase n=1 Tax=Clostridium guangxiense TaxID=1662055 RepID=UPI001E648691|nr:CYTH domain-containing protein [Clostridium guangxiense]MCD2346584.1 CYTH domain-containing protein [Clostridium guangxiense]
MNEIETRILNINVDDLRKKLLNLKLPIVKKENQINDIYDFNDKRLLANKGYARIRTIQNMLDNTIHYYMTVKKLLSQEKYKIMEENETEILSGDEGKKIFVALGLSNISSIKKYRESYKYKHSLIEIDINDKSFCPFPYIEIETSKEDELKEIVHFLGYTLADTTSKTIYEILNEKGIKGI